MHDETDAPALVDVQGKRTLLVNKSMFLVGRRRDADLPIYLLCCSRDQFQVRKEAGGWLLVPLSQSNEILCDGQKVQGPTPITDGTRIEFGATKLMFFDPKTRRRELPPEDNQKTAFGDRSDWERLIRQKQVELLKDIRLNGLAVLGRDAAAGVEKLNHPTVSRRHAQVNYSNGRATIADLGSTNGTYVNGERIISTVELTNGALVEIGPFSLTYSRGTLRSESRVNNIELAAIQLQKTRTDRITGQPKRLLDDINLVVRPREFVCLIGGSGAGKSTLLNALSFRARADSGSVLLNGTDLGQHFRALKRDIAVVQQKDILLEMLTIRQSLNYTAQLRLPSDTSDEERATRVDDLIDQMCLTPKKDMCIKHLSGGQIKRVSLANELLSDPSLIFLDEVTSGLDDATDHEMMKVFRDIADQGKTVICITHSLTHVAETCTHVAVLAEGGKLVFYGTPAEALKYFHVSRLGDVYNLLASNSEMWRDKFKQSEQYAIYVESRLPKSTSATLPAHHQRASGPRLGDYVRHSSILLRRYARTFFSDRGALAWMVAQFIVIAFCISALLGDISRDEAVTLDSNLTADRSVEGEAKRETIVKATVLEQRFRKTTTAMFVLAVAVFWFGCNNAAKEIVKERLFYIRERDANLHPLAYLTSKWLLLGVITVIQSLCLIVLTRAWTGFEGDLPQQCIAVSIAAINGVSLGILISTASSSENVALTFVPILVIPQLLFAGVLRGLPKEIEPVVSPICTSYFCCSALFQSVWNSDFKDTLSRSNMPKLDFGTCIVSMIVQTAVLVIVTCVALHLKDRPRSE